MFKRFIHLTTIIILMLAISVSFAWMMDVTTPTGYYPVLRFDETNNLYIVSNDVDISLQVEKDDEFVEIANNRKTDNDLFSAKNLGPGSALRYRLVVKNNTAVDVNMSIILSDIYSSLEYFYDVVYLGVYYAEGFYAPFEPPKIEEYCLNDLNRLSIGENDERTFNLINYFKIPGDYSEVTIGFYIRIANEADNRLEKQWLNIDKINFIII